MIKLLISTKQTQGDRPDDFCWVPEGEIVHFSWECSTAARREICGCGRSMVGIVCGKATTTMIVRMMPYKAWELRNLIWKHWEETGFVSKNCVPQLRRSPEDATKMAEDLILAAIPFEVDQIIERRNLVLQERLLG